MGEEEKEEQEKKGKNNSDLCRYANYFG